MSIASIFTYFILVLLLSLVSLLTKKINVQGAVLGGFITFNLCLAFGLAGLIAIASFFVFGTLVSVWRRSEKRKLQLEESNEGKRGIPNVLGNAGVAAIISMLFYAFPTNPELYLLMFFSSFASALSDTFSSELGNVYGNRYFNILTLKKGVRGEDGTVSWEGFLFGGLGSLIMSVIGYFWIRDMNLCLILCASGILGNIADSVLGASLQKKQLLNNHSVNFVSIVIAVLISISLYYLLLK